MHPPVSVTPDAPAREALKVLLENRVPGVPVEDDGKLAGFISDRHLLGSALPEYLLSLWSLSFVDGGADSWAPYFTEAADRPVREVMSRKVARIEIGKSVFAAAHMMLKEGVSSVVVTKNDEVVGIVNRLDLYATIEGLDGQGAHDRTG